MWPNQARYPVSIESLVEIPILMLMQEDLLRDPLNRLHPMMVQGKLQLCSRVESVGKQHRAEGVSEKASSLIISGWSKGTNATYQSAWKKWCCWCTKQCIDPISYDVCCLVNFLAELLDQGVQQCSINTITSAISMTHTQVNGLPIGQHPLVNRLVKGVYNCRPLQPRYSTTWDVDIVVRYIQKFEGLSLKQVGQKLTVLMVLVEANCLSELAALDIHFHIFKPEGVLFRLATLTKKRKTGALPKEFFRAYPHDKRLCVVECLRYYETCTNQFRCNRTEEIETRLFLSHVKKPLKLSQLHLGALPIG